MKSCPFCAEEIQDAAVKCKHCGEFLDPRFKPKGEEARPWYFRTPTVVSTILCLLPFALPLVWFNPYYSRKTKIVCTVIVAVLTFLVWVAVDQSLKALEEYYKIIFG